MAKRKPIEKKEPERVWTTDQAWERLAPMARWAIGCELTRLAHREMPGMPGSQVKGMVARWSQEHGAASLSLVVGFEGKKGEVLWGLAEAVAAQASTAAKRGAGKSEKKMVELGMRAFEAIASWPEGDFSAEWDGAIRAIQEGETQKISVGGGYEVRAWVSVERMILAAREGRLDVEDLIGLLLDPGKGQNETLRSMLEAVALNLAAQRREIETATSKPMRL